MGKQGGKGESAKIAVGGGHPDGKGGGCEFGEDLEAEAAGGGGFAGDEHEVIEAQGGACCRHGAVEGDALGAEGGSVAGVFDVATGKDPSILQAQCRAHGVTRVGAVRVFACGESRVPGFQDVGRRVHGRLLLPDREAEEKSKAEENGGGWPWWNRIGLCRRPPDVYSENMETEYQDYVRAFAVLREAGGSLPLGGFGAPERAGPRAGAPTAMLFSPHPDDESITGLLPLRLANEDGWRILNVPVTHGSLPSRQPGRHAELQAACGYLGWDLAQSPPPAPPLPHPPFSVAGIAALLRHHRPAAVFFPHERDWNTRHTETHRMVMDALGEMDAGFSCVVVETEFWGAMDDPNLMVEAGVAELGDLVAALSFHAGEVTRNPYHLLLPAWMMDNVRRGGERLGGQGGAAPDCPFATLYRVSRWSAGRLHRAPPVFIPLGVTPEAVLLG